MVNKPTKIKDIIVPEVFLPYVDAELQKTPFFDSGIVQKAAVNLGDNLTRGGNTINMPFWKPLTPGADILSEDTPLSLNAITADNSVAVLQFRGKAFGATDLSAQLSGADPMKAIAAQVANFWAKSMQKILLSELKGVFLASSMTGNVLDISAEPTTGAIFTSESLLDAAQLLGDNKDSLTAIAMHSAVETKLAKDNLIEYERDETGTFMYKSYMGKRVIVSDDLPVEDGAYTSYLFGAGAVGYNEGGVLEPLEYDRDKLGGIDALITRKAFVLHPYGTSWVGTAAGATPTDTELETGTNWKAVYANKDIPIVKLKAKLAANV